MTHPVIVLPIGGLRPAGKKSRFPAETAHTPRADGNGMAVSMSVALRYFARSRGRHMKPAALAADARLKPATAAD